MRATFATLVATLGLATLLLTPLIPTTEAQAPVGTLALIENGCPEGHTFCFALESGSLQDLQAGGSYLLRVKNSGSTSHDLHISALHDRDPDQRNTDREVAFAATERIAPGEDELLSFDIPEDLHNIYLWCDVSGHEQLGMWVAVPLAQGGGGPPEGGLVDRTDEGTDGDATGGSENGAPVPAALGLLALAGAALGLRRRR